MLKGVSTDFYIFKENDHSFRNVKSLDQPSVNPVNFGRKLLGYQEVIIWEKMPNEVKLSKSPDQF